MFLPYAREEHFLQLLAEVSVVVEYPHNAILNNVCYKQIHLNVSTLIVLEKQKCYIAIARKFRFMPQFGEKNTNFAEEIVQHKIRSE